MSSQFYEQLKKYDITPKKSLGQNFLKDANIIKKITALVKNFPDKHILEVGPGVASLSKEILAQNPRKLSCIEYDNRCVNFLKEQFSQSKNIEIYHADALEFDETALVTPNDKLTLLANLPYNIASVLLIKWLGNIHIFEEMILMFQREVAERICAQVNTKQYGILSVLAQYLCDCRIAFNISPKCFYPEPKIESSIVILKPKQNAATLAKVFPELKELVKILFNMRRKTIFNNLKKINENPGLILEQADIDKHLRPENLSIEDFVKLLNLTH